MPLDTMMTYDREQETHTPSAKTKEIAESLKSTLVSRNISIFGRRTSIRLEPQMWKSLEQIAHKEQCKIHDIGSLVAASKEDKSSLTAAIRVFILLYYKAAATDEGHHRAGHGNIERMKQRIRFEEEKKAS